MSLLFLLGLSLHGFAQGNKADTSHVSDKSFCVIRLDVKRLASQLNKTKKDFDQIADIIRKEARFELKEMTAVTIQFGDSDVSRPEPSFGITFEFGKPYDKDLLMEEYGGPAGGYEEAKLNGKTYLKASRPGGPHFYFESNQKFTMATQGAIEAVLSAGGMGKMASGIKSAPAGSEVVVVFNRTEKFAESIGTLSRMSKEIPVPFDFENLVKNINSGFAFVNLEKSNPIKLQIEMSSAEQTKKLTAGIEAMVKVGKVTIEPAREQLTEQMKSMGEGRFAEAQTKMMQAGLDGLTVAEKILNGIKLTQNEQKLNLDVRAMGGLTEIADLLVSGLNLTFLGMSAMDGPAEVAPAIEREAIKEAVKK